MYIFSLYLKHSILGNELKSQELLQEIFLKYSSIFGEKHIKTLDIMQDIISSVSFIFFIVVF